MKIFKWVGWLCVSMWLIPCCFAQADSSTQLQQWTAASGGNDHYYQAHASTATITWTDANNAAAAQGGYLATITSAAENTFVFNLVNDQTYWFQSANNHGPWIGGFQPPGSPEPAGNFQWVLQPGASVAEPFSYTNWTTGEPSNDGGTEDRIDLFKNGTGRAATWNDAPDSNTFVRSYVVEFNTPEPSAASLALLIGFAVTGRRKRKC
jgi:hypothetical protein